MHVIFEFLPGACLINRHHCVNGGWQVPVHPFNKL